jgi:hypothetical protein
MSACPGCCRAGVTLRVTPRHPKRAVGTVEYFAFVKRVLRALSRRVGDADLVALGEMAALRDELEGHIVDAVARLRHDPVLPASWADIGAALKVSRQYAARRYGKGGGARRPGGQRGDWR